MKAHLAFASIALLLSAACGKSEQAAPEDHSARMAQAHKDDSPRPSPAAQAAPGAATRSQIIRYATLGGRELNGYLAYPAAAEGGLPGVLVFHEWWGLNDNIRSMADQLAAQGYVALAADFYGGQVATTPDIAKSLVQKALADPQALGDNIRQAHAYLKEQVKATRVGTIGWCFGGAMSLKAAVLLADQVDAAIIYYGHLDGVSPGELRKVQAPLLGIFGSLDQGIPVSAVQQFDATLQQLGKPAEIHIYEGANHAFANPSGGNYKPDAAADAWQKAIRFLATHLKQG